MLGRNQGQERITKPQKEEQLNVTQGDEKLNRPQGEEGCKTDTQPGSKTKRLVAGGWARVKGLKIPDSASAAAESGHW